MPVPLPPASPLRSRFGYAAADAAAALIWNLAGGYLIVFYTDVARLPAAAVGTMLLLVRLTDAALDPLLGLMIDRTRTRWGKCRPYLLWTSVPLGALSVLTFTSPDWSEPGKLAWAYGTYLLLSAVYSLANIPMISILAGLSSDPHERMRLSSWKSVGSILATGSAGAAMLPVVAYVGQGDDARGYRIAMTLFGLLAAVLLLYAFATLRERPAKARPRIHHPLRTALRGNQPLALALALVVLINLGGMPRYGTTVFFFRDYLGREDLVPVVNLAQGSLLLGLPAAVWLVKSYGKRNTAVITLIVQALGMIIPAALGARPWPVIIGAVFSNIAGGALLGTMFAMAADLIDFAEWRSGIRAEGLIGSLLTFANKVGIALGGAVTGWLLALGHYDPDLTSQSANTLLAIRFCYYGLPTVLMICTAILLRFYRLDPLLPQIRAELSGRHGPAPDSGSRALAAY